MNTASIRYCLFFAGLVIFGLLSCHQPSGGNYLRTGARDSVPVGIGGRWSEQRAQQWYRRQGDWMAGCNYIPSDAINQLEMWQASTFDSSRINLELGWAQHLGFRVVRVFLHNLLWKQDSLGFLRRMDLFLQIAHRHNIGAMFVFFDGCWNPDPHLGRQALPRPHVHNSRWVQSPGAVLLSDTSNYGQLKEYVQGVLRHFKNDSRVKVWDLFNEPDNDNGGRFRDDLDSADKYYYAFILLKDVFRWARDVNPSQPLTAAPWHRDWSDTSRMDPMDKFMFDHSDVISFHCYDPLDRAAMNVRELKRYNRPLICSEYMARPVGSNFEAILPYFKSQEVSALNWGFVSGKTQTIYPWDSWTRKYSRPPKIWFHDVFHRDGRPFDPKEVKLIRKLTGQAGNS